jgi:hypothetical protein
LARWLIEPEKEKMRKEEMRECAERQAGEERGAEEQAGERGDVFSKIAPNKARIS